MTRGMPQANGSVAVEPVFDPRHVADAVLYMASLPLDTNVQFLTITATTMPYIGRGEAAMTNLGELIASPGVRPGDRQLAHRPAGGRSRRSGVRGPRSPCARDRQHGTQTLGGERHEPRPPRLHHGAGGRQRGELR